VIQIDGRDVEWIPLAHPGAIRRGIWREVHHAVWCHGIHA
jgi:hypothetical protein